MADGYGFLAFDYRGFPGSPGEVTEENILADGLAAFDWAAAKGFPVVLWGRSLGSGPATYVASLRDADALLLETPFDSAVAVAADRYGFLPVGLLMPDQFPVDQWIDGRRRAGVRRARHGRHDHRRQPWRTGLRPGAEQGRVVDRARCRSRRPVGSRASGAGRRRSSIAPRQQPGAETKTPAPEDRRFVVAKRSAQYRVRPAKATE